MLPHCLKSSLRIPLEHKVRNSHPCSHLRIISCVSKHGIFNPNQIPFGRKDRERLIESPYLAQRLSPSHVIPQLRSGITLIRYL